MNKILFGALEEDFYFLRSYIETLEEAGYDVVKFSDAGLLREAMVSGEGDFVVLFGGAMLPGLFAEMYFEECGRYAGFLAVSAAREQGSEIPVMVLRTSLSPPKWAFKLSHMVFSFGGWSFDNFLARVEELLGEEEKDASSD